MDLHPCLFCLSFYLLYFFLPPFKDNGLLFWVTDVLCQHSEVVLWNLLSVQMSFWWICGGESGLPVLFLRHLRTTPVVFFSNPWQYLIFTFLSCVILYSFKVLSITYFGHIQILSSYSNSTGNYNNTCSLFLTRKEKLWFKWVCFAYLGKANTLIHVSAHYKIENLM